MVLPRLSLAWICTGAFVLAMLALIANTRRSNVTDPHPAQHQPFSDPVRAPHTARNEPPRCVQQKSGHYLAVASVGAGFPCVQYTCTTGAELGHGHGPHDSSSSVPTAAPVPPCRKSNGKGCVTSPQESYADSPAYPTPQQSPLPPPRKDGRGSTDYTHLLHTPPWSGSGMGYTGRRGELPPHNAFVYSPRERAADQTTTVSSATTTTTTFSEDKQHLPVPSNQRTSQDCHHLAGLSTSPQQLQPKHPDQQKQQPQQQPQQQGAQPKRVIHRVTTLIIETQTIISRPRATKA